VRLDFFLKLSRLCPRRSVAQQLCDAGLVLLNGRKAKPAHPVKIDDEIVIHRPDREIVARILRVPAGKSVSRSEAGQLIEVATQPIEDI